MAEKNAIMQTLHHCAFFAEFDDEALEAVASIGSPSHFKKHQVVMREGEFDNNCYVVVKGEVQISKKGPDGEDVSLIRLRHGDFVGLGSLLTDTPHNATVSAVGDDTVLLQLSSDALLKLIAQNPTVAKALLRYFAQELRQFRSKLVDVKGHVAEDDENTIVFFDAKQYEKDVFNRHRQEAKEAQIFFKYTDVKLNKDSAKLAAGAKAICIFVNDTCNADVLAELSGLGVDMVLLRCAGFNNVDLKAAGALGITVATVPRYSPYAVAEHAAALIMSLNRKIPRAHGRVMMGNFTLNGLVGFDLYGKTVGVLGTGKIGQCFINIMVGFGCKVLCYDTYPVKDLEKLPGVKYADLDTVLRNSHVFSLHAPLTPETKHIINRETIAKMPTGAMIINTSRGALVDTKALVEGLKSKQVGYAGLDVYEEEADYFFEDRSGSVIDDDVLARLMSFPNVIITAHQAFLTNEALEAITKTTIANAREFFVENKKLKQVTNSVNLG